MTQYQPDVVSIRLGTNDLRTGADGAETARRLDDLVGRIHAVNPDVYVAAVPAIAARYQAQGRRLAVVDMSHLLSVPLNVTDGTLPTQLGYDLMARTLYPAVATASSTVG